MYECNLNGDCCHSYVPFHATIEHVYLFNSELWQLSLYFSAVSLSRSLYLTLSFHFIGTWKLASFWIVNELSTSVYRSTAGNRALLNQALMCTYVRLQVCFSFEVDQVCIRMSFPFRSVVGHYIANGSICQKWFGNFRVSASAVYSFESFFVCILLFVFAHSFSAATRMGKQFTYTCTALYSIYWEKTEDAHDRLHTMWIRMGIARQALAWIAIRKKTLAATKTPNRDSTPTAIHS